MLEESGATYTSLLNSLEYSIECRTTIKQVADAEGAPREILLVTFLLNGHEVCSFDAGAIKPGHMDSCLAKLNYLEKHLRRRLSEVIFHTVWESYLFESGQTDKAEVDRLQRIERAFLRERWAVKSGPKTRVTKQRLWEAVRTLSETIGEESVSQKAVAFQLGVTPRALRNWQEKNGYDSWGQVIADCLRGRVESNNSSSD